MNSDAATTAMYSCASDPKPWSIQVTSMYAAQPDAGECEEPAEEQAVLEPEARRMRSNQGSFSPM